MTLMHAHDHHHGMLKTRPFAIGVALNVVYIVVEVIAGLLVGSLALLADAGHNLSDVLGLLLAWGAAYLSALKPSERRTYGWRSTSILAALINSLILMVAVGGIAWEAFRRFTDPQPVSGWAVVWVAAAGVVINGLTTMLFVKGRHHDLNVKGAFLHMAADTLVSVGVVIAGLAMLATGLRWIDPLVSLLVALVILVSTWGLLRDSFNMALQAVPPGISPVEVRRYLTQLPGVQEVHDLHIWAMSTTETALTAHLVKPHLEDEDGFLQQASEGLRQRFGVQHTTIQIERSSEAARCGQAPDDVV